MESKFSVIDQFREEAKKRELPITLSMGFSYGDGEHDEIGKVALLNLNLAEVRGGDQAVVKKNEKPYFLWWGNSFGCEADSDSHTRYDDSYFG